MSSSSASRSPPVARRRSKEAIPGSIRGYDVRTGALKWTFHTIPQQGEFGNDTWKDNSWEYTGNTGVWTPFTADAERGYVYLPIEAPTGDFYGGHRHGDNLFSDSRRVSRCGHGQARLALPDASSRCLGLRPAGAARAARYHGEGEEDSRRRAGDEDGHSRSCSTGTRASPCGRSRNGPCRSRTCRARRPRPRSPFPTKPAPFEAAGPERRGPHRLHAGAQAAGAGDREQVSLRPDVHPAVSRRRGGQEARHADPAESVGRRELGRARLRIRRRAFCT